MKRNIIISVLVIFLLLGGSFVYFINADSDGDGLSWSTEKKYGTDPGNSDTDKDNLVDGQEIMLGTDPKNSDTDSDGLSDGEEVHTYTTNPLVTEVPLSYKKCLEEHNVIAGAKALRCSYRVESADDKKTSLGGKYEACVRNEGNIQSRYEEGAQFPKSYCILDFYNEKFTFPKTFEECRDGDKGMFVQRSANERPSCIVNISPTGAKNPNVAQTLLDECVRQGGVSKGFDRPMCSLELKEGRAIFANRSDWWYFFLPESYASIRVPRTGELIRWLDLIPQEGKGLNVLVCGNVEEKKELLEKQFKRYTQSELHTFEYQNDCSKKLSSLFAKKPDLVIFDYITPASYSNVPRWSKDDTSTLFEYFRRGGRVLVMDEYGYLNRIFKQFLISQKDLLTKNYETATIYPFWNSNLPNKTVISDDGLFIGGFKDIPPATTTSHPLYGRLAPVLLEGIVLGFVEYSGSPPVMQLQLEGGPTLMVEYACKYKADFIDRFSNVVVHGYAPASSLRSLAFAGGTATVCGSPRYFIEKKSDFDSR